MNQFAEQLLKTSNYPFMAPMNQNYNLINQVPMPQLLQNQQTMQYSKNIPKNVQKKFNPSKPQSNNPQDNSK